ncbi:MAG: glycyl-tRNA synthetase subunit beta [Pseudomonadota bacterium]
MGTVENKNLLVELFVEELPPKALKKLGEVFAVALAASLKAQGLVADSAALTSFASPRRLAAHIKAVATKAVDKSLQQKLMPVAVALDANGAPTPALLKKLAALGAEASAVPTLKRQMDGKAEALFLDSVVAGATLAEGLQKALDEAIAKLPIPKVMTYQLADGWSDVKFVRPAHRLVALHGAEVVPVTALGLAAGRVTQGHRFMAEGAIELATADDYERDLRERGKVIASFAERRHLIESRLDALGISSEESDGVVKPEALLDEVAALVEWPVVYECHFDSAFLEVPQECLILTMQTNQKYFACTLGGTLVNRFLLVSNIETSDPTAIVRGNERVVRPRLADAKFFFDQDRKRRLETRVSQLDRVVYHGQLGSQGERVARVQAIARSIGLQLGAGAKLAEQADRAALLAKTDLLTDMVGEFPELQGTMGWYYARHDGEDNEVAIAIEDHYKPRFAGDALPRNEAGIIVALADKLETLVGLFGIGQLPTGDKDPFALRRHALGVIRMLIERQLPLALDLLVDAALPAFGGKLKVDPRGPLLDFIRDRLAGQLRDEGYSAQEVDAVLALQPRTLADVPQRLAAVRVFAQLPEAASLAAANKRVGNILKKADGVVLARIDAALLKEPAEAALAAALHQAQPSADRCFANGEYTAALRELAVLKAPVDAFFDSVMVNADDPALRANRLGLLASLHAAMNRVADLSRLAA